MKDDRARYDRVLARIIEKYTATPREDPEFVDYAERPARPASRRKPAERQRVTANASRRAR
jgi:hypothetical protein